MSSYLRFPVGLWKHWHTCDYDDCPKCSDYINWIHAWQRRNPNSDKVIARTVDDLLEPRLRRGKVI